MNTPYIKTKDSITVLLGGAPYTVANDHTRYAELDQAISAQNWGTVEEIVLNQSRLAASLKKFGDVEVFGGHLTFKGEPFVSYLVEQILTATDPEPLAWFLDKSMMNPDPRARRDLYRWVEAGKLPITSDGEIIAYKVVNENFRDKYSNKFDNSPGKVVEQPRDECNPDPNKTCSHGLHFCSAGYLTHSYVSSGRTILVKVHPRDVVAFPTDYGLTKGRACRYEVIEEIPGATARSFFDDFTGHYQVKSPASEPATGYARVKDTNDNSWCVRSLKNPEDFSFTWIESKATIYPVDEAQHLVGMYALALDPVPEPEPEPETAAEARQIISGTQLVLVEVPRDA